MTSTGWQGLLVTFSGIVLAGAGVALALSWSESSVWSAGAISLSLAITAITAIAALGTIIAVSCQDPSLADITRALQHAPGGFLAATRRGRIIAGNESLCQILGYPELTEAEQLSGLNLANLFDDALWAALVAERHTLAQGSTATIEIDLERADGSRARLACEARLSRGLRRHYLIHINDLTAARQAARATTVAHSRCAVS